jgi:hypothetical protein
MYFSMYYSRVNRIEKFSCDANFAFPRNLEFNNKPCKTLVEELILNLTIPREWLQRSALRYMLKSCHRNSGSCHREKERERERE